MSHHCHARGCSKKVKPELLMCLDHWKMVPRKIQRAVWAAYRPGQCDDKKPSGNWMRAADAAIGHVANAEGRPLRDVEVEAVEEFLGPPPLTTLQRKLLLKLEEEFRKSCLDVDTSWNEATRKRVLNVLVRRGFVKVERGVPAVITATGRDALARVS